MSRPSRSALITAAAARLASAGVPDPARDARLLLRWAAGLDGAAFSARLSDSAPAAEAARFEQAIRAREGRAPVSHITGTRQFWGRHFRITPDVLDPRPETEILIAQALQGRPAANILDLGTGSGCILLTLLAEWPDAHGVGVDISEAALAVAADNANALGVAARVDLVRADWCAGLAGRFDLVVANPPYIADSEIAALAPEVRLFEPRMALTPGAGSGGGEPGDGLSAYRRIAARIGPLLAPRGRLLFEIGPSQAHAVSEILTDSGLTVTAVLPDLDGRDRVLFAEY